MTRCPWASAPGGGGGACTGTARCKQETERICVLAQRHFAGTTQVKRTLRGAQRRGGRRRLRSELRGPRQPPRAGEQPERVSGALGRAGHRGSEVLRTLGPCGVGPPLFGSCRWGCQFCGLGWSPLCQLTSPPSFPCCPFCKVQKSPILQALHTRPRSARRPLLPPAHALRRLLPARGAGQSPPPPSAAPPAAAARPCPPREAM